MSLPLSVELVGISIVNLAEFFLQVRSEVDAGVEVFPDEGVVLNISDKHNDEIVCIAGGRLLDIVLLGHISSGEIPDTVHRDYSYVLYGSQQILLKMKNDCLKSKLKIKP